MKTATPNYKPPQVKPGEVPCPEGTPPYNRHHYEVTGAGEKQHMRCVRCGFERPASLDGQNPNGNTWPGSAHHKRGVKGRFEEGT